MSDKITLKYEGKSVTNGTIDVRALAPSLLEFSKLLDEINKELNQGEPLRIDVAATKEGSFEIELLIGLINPDNIQIAQDLFVNYKSVKEAVLELFKLKNFLKGKPAKEIIESPENPEKKQVMNIDGKICDVNNGTINIAQNFYVGEAMESFTNKSITSSDDSVAVIDEDKPQEKIAISTQELSYYQKPEPLEIQEEIIAERKMEVSLTMYSPVFNEKNKWKLKDSHNNILSVDIEDEDFIKRYMEGDISFNINDILVCNVAYTEFKNTKGELKATDYKITKVTKYIPSPKQRQLPL